MVVLPPQIKYLSQAHRPKDTETAFCAGKKHMKKALHTARRKNGGRRGNIPEICWCLCTCLKFHFFYYTHSVDFCQLFISQISLKFL
jgi:hypothetical protein